MKSLILGTPLLLCLICQSLSGTAQTSLNGFNGDTVSTNEFENIDTLFVQVDSTMKYGKVEVTSYQLVFAPKNGDAFVKRIYGDRLVKSEHSRVFSTLKTGDVLILDSITGASSSGKVNLPPIILYFR